MEYIFRGLTTKGEWVHGSLVTTNAFVKHMPKQHTKHWIVTSAFGNGGWFNIRLRSYVKPETVGQFTGLKDNQGTDIYADDVVFLAGYGNYTCEFPFMELYDAYPEGDIGAIRGNIHQHPELI